MVERAAVVSPMTLANASRMRSCLRAFFSFALSCGKEHVQPAQAVSGTACWALVSARGYRSRTT